MRSSALAVVVLATATLHQAPKCLAQELRVRLLDVRNLRPVANQTITVQFHISGTPELQSLEEKTDGDGVASFVLPNTIGEEISVHDSQLYPCYSLAPIKTQEIFSEGVLSRCSKPSQGCRCTFGKQVSSLTTSSGELVILARPFTKSERVRSHIWE